VGRGARRFGHAVRVSVCRRDIGLPGETPARVRRRPGYDNGTVSVALQGGQGLIPGRFRRPLGVIELITVERIQRPPAGPTVQKDISDE